MSLFSACIITAVAVSLIWFFIYDIRKFKLELQVIDLKYKLRDVQSNYEALLVEYAFLANKFGIKNKPVDPLENAYRILGLDKRASMQEVKNKYRMLVKRYHPDTLKTKDSKKFREVNEAYALIKSKVSP
jgi:DnaJ-domain-containing protein 1